MHFLMYLVQIDSHRGAGSPPKAKCHCCGASWIRPGAEAAEGAKTLLQEHIQLRFGFCPLGPSLVRVPLIPYVTRFMAEEMTACPCCLYDGSD